MERTTIFQYRVFDEETNSSIADLIETSSLSECGNFKGKISITKKGNSRTYKPIIQWADTTRPQVGFHLKTITIAMDDMIQDGNGFKIFQHGYQSWSLSTSYNPNEKDVSPKIEFLRYSQENIYSDHSGEEGDFLSESFICLYSKELDSGIICGLLVGSDPGVRFHSAVDENGKILEISCILDFHCSLDVKTNGKLPLPELTGISFSGSPEKAIANYIDSYAKNTEIPILAKKVPTGWCSWYYYYTDITEKIILDNLKDIKDKNIPIQFFQVDDGYQRTIGDWLTTNEKFPAGMKIIADEIKREGYQPGIWLAPFLVRKESEFYNKYPEAVLKDENGDPVPALWNPLWGKDYTYCLDLTHPKSLEFLTQVFKTITKDWGYPYLKLDFLYAGLLPGVVYNPNITPQARYQNALKLIRKVVGKDTFLLGCGAPIFPSVGYFQGMRISCDVAPFWRAELKRRLVRDKNALCTEKALINDLTRASMHRKFWFNDPDCLVVRKKKNSMNYNQTLIMASVMAVSGGMLLVSDDMTKLEPERLEMLKKTLELSKLCQAKTPLPIGIFEGQFPEGLWNPAGYLGVWNPTDKSKTIKMKTPVAIRNTEWIDYWTGNKEISVQYDNDSQILEIELPAYGSRVFSIES
ncbi:glycoside hydrolase family 36 protein [Leptospira sp. GIMC2001]|uniref:glycoside hydrolase family 36 protein n=1 Tax=Leptospira sp. GIMC2001 TaxID=1513297 RepID=UPI00234BD6F7|nr:glycoside hydrolase family 36 protein [Leptospira sp. GIMC2001]WCL48235.1 alpha-galactosidase [Leptospira sp. GIMC2001]